MSIKTVMINQFAALMVSSDIFKIVKTAVSTISAQNMTGVEKRTAVLKDLEHIGERIGSWALNLLIELAVGYFKTKVV